MKYRLLLLLIILCPVLVSAQSNYKPGYVVTLNGDTIKGRILYKKKEKDFKFVYMIKPGGTEAEQFPAGQTAGFGVYGVASYQSFTVSISQDTPLDMRFTFGEDTTTVVDKVFLRRLISGPNITLYSYTDEIKQRFFISEKNGAPAELEYHEYVDAINQLNPVTDARYKIQLQKLRAIYQPGDKALINQIQESDYDILHLAKIAARLNANSTAN